MEIINVSKSISEIIETDGKGYNIYRRHGVDNWEVLMGESWESFYDNDEIEGAYQRYKDNLKRSRCDEKNQVY